MLRCRVVMIAIMAALLAGCTATTNGTVVGAPTLGHAPAPLRNSALPELLATSAQIAIIMGSSMESVDSSDAMYVNAALPDGCLVWAEAQDHNYKGSNWSAIRLEVLKDRRDDPDHIVYQSVVSFPDALAAHNFYQSQVSSWTGCDNRRVDLHDSGDPNPHYWSLSRANEEDGLLTITRAEEERVGWACQHALTATNNVIADTSACADNIGDRAARIAKLIAKNISERQ